MIAPTEQEIRTAIQAALDDSDIDIGAWVHDLVRPLSYAPPEQRGNNYGGCLWDDLRPSQAALLEALIEGIYNKVQPLEDDVTARIRESVVEAALEFAAAYPDAPRANVEVMA
jgi:hypothetical protein